MLPRSHRLPSFDISNVLRRGKRIRGGGGVDFVYIHTDGVPRFAFVVSHKIDKRATERNRKRRLLREAVRRNQEVPSVDGVMVVRSRLPDSQVAVDAIVRDLFADVPEAPRV